tara:strand:+ start:2557 stop:2982 length:426 start_codon:yes stop_codon:yes gene_type:complete
VLIVKTSNRKILTLPLAGQIARESQKLEILTGQKLDSDNIVPLVATGVRAKTASRISTQRNRAERHNLKTESWEITILGETTTVASALETDSGREHIESRIKSHLSRSETDSRRGEALQRALRRALRAENKKLRAELDRLR